MTAIDRRVAIFRYTETNLVQPVIESGLDIAYYFDADFGTEYVDFDNIPHYDLVAACLPHDPEERVRAWRFVNLFIEARTPVSFALAIGNETAESFVEVVGNNVESLGYVMEPPRRGGGDTFVVGTLREDSFTWPASVVPVVGG